MGETSDYSLHYSGWGLAWLKDDSLLGKMFTIDKFDLKISTFLKTILSKPDCPRFLINGLKDTLLPTSSVRGFRVHGQPFDTYVMFSPKDNTLIWSEIHVHSVPSPKVLIRETLKNAGRCPANYYLIEALPGLQLYAISPPQNEPFTVNTNDYGIAIIATAFKTHKGSGHSHQLGEKESGMLGSTINFEKGSCLDDVRFHCEVLDLKEVNFFGHLVWKIECKFDFGNKGELCLPIFALPRQQNPEDPVKKGDYILGFGSLQLFQIPKQSRQYT